MNKGPNYWSMEKPEEEAVMMEIAPQAIQVAMRRPQPEAVTKKSGF